ncbi:MAG: hypothetical protein Q4B89_08115 [Lachnospiraceae bacterium]|nr:hypothetical protein [Lachnospiraceae bacterium]
MKNVKKYLPYIMDVIIYIVIGIGIVRNWIALNILLLILLPKITLDEFREWKENRKISTFISFLALFVGWILQIALLIKTGKLL